MASIETPTKERTQIVVLDFMAELGEMSPIDGLRGPKTPSRRQVLRHFLFFVAMGSSLIVAAEKVVPNLLKKYAVRALKSPKKLRDNIVDMYKAIRCK